MLPYPVAVVRDSHTWMLFADWCTAHEQSSLPATPELLARFLHAHPAATATQQRRIAVIGAVHRRYALTSPGRSDAVRAAVDSARSARVGELAARLGAVIARLPDTGWPAALFARRDALILTLAATGLPYSQLAALGVCDVGVDPVVDALHVETADGTRASTPTALIDAGVSPSAVYRRWIEVLGFSGRYFNTRMLAELLTTGDGAELARHDSHIDLAEQRPLLTSIDRWGHMPLTATALSAPAIAGITAVHLSGNASVHQLPDKQVKSAMSVYSEAALAGEPLDSSYHQRGIDARKNAHTTLTEALSILDDVEDRADRLLAELSRLVGTEPTVD